DRAHTGPQRVQPGEDKRDAAGPTVLKTDGNVSRVAWAPDGRTVAAVVTAPYLENRVINSDRVSVHSIKSTVQLWDADRGKLTLSLPVEKSTRFDSLVFS